jgi:hypothetical protein
MSKTEWSQLFSFMLILNDQLHHHLENWDETVHEKVLSTSENVTEEVDDIMKSEMKKNISLEQLYAWISTFPFRVLLFGFILGSFIHSKHSLECILHSSSICMLIIGVWLGSNAKFLLSVVTKTLQTTQSTKQMEVFQILLSIGAISFDDPHTILHEISKGLDYTEILKVTITFRRFLHCIDMSFERIKSATSMKLGLGIWSPAIYRVDSNNRNEITLPSQRRIIAQGLQTCLSLLTNESQLDEIENYTLTCLQDVRRKLPCAFLTFLTECTTHEELQMLGQKLTELEQTLDAVILQLPELETTHFLYPVAQHLHAAEISLWASFHDSSSQEEWLKRFQSLVKIVSGRLGNTMEITTPHPPEDEESKSDPNNVASEIIAGDKSCLEDDDDNDDSPNTAYKNTISKVPTKTLIFFGTGQAEKPPISNSSIPHGTVSSYPLRPMTIPGNLLQELQEALVSLPTADEINAHEYQEKDYPSNRVDIKLQKPYSKSEDEDITRLVSNQLFQELQSSIQLRNICAKEMDDEFITG